MCVTWQTDHTNNLLHKLLPENNRVREWIEHSKRLSHPVNLSRIQQCTHPHGFSLTLGTRFLEQLGRQVLNMLVSTTKTSLSFCSVSSPGVILMTFFGRKIQHSISVMFQREFQHSKHLPNILLTNLCIICEYVSNASGYHLHWLCEGQLYYTSVDVRVLWIFWHVIRFHEFISVT